MRPWRGGRPAGVPVGGMGTWGVPWLVGGWRRVGSLGKSVQSGVHHDRYGSESAARLDLNSYIFRDVYPSGGARRKREAPVATPVVLEPLSHSPSLRLRFEREVPIKRDYFPAVYTGAAEFLSRYRAVPII